MVPLLLLGWFGTYIAQNEQKVLQSQFDALIQAQLKSVDNKILDYFLDKEQFFMKAYGKSNLPIKQLLQMEALPAVRQVFTLEAGGQRLYPEPQEVMSRKHEEFLQRTKHLWQDVSVLYQAPVDVNSGNSNEEYQKETLSLFSSRSASKEVAQQKASPKAAKSKIEKQLQQGWYVWHFNNEINHIFWWKTPDQKTVAVEFFPARVLADLIARLPETSAQDSLQAKSRIRLLNDHGSVVYQWGLYEPAENAAYLGFLPLSHPLGSWRLLYFGNYQFGYSLFNWFNIVIGLVVLGVALFVMAFYLYKEQTREMTLAIQRVNFVNQVSHELKTPLTNIRLYAELLEQQLIDSGDNKVNRYIDIITAECQRLSRLIANVLSFSRAERDKLTLTPVGVNLNDVIKKVIENHEVALAEKQMQVQNNGALPLRLMADQDFVEQILNNLISNAEKYAASGEQLKISTDYRHPYAIITVQDCGPGIHTRDAEKIFAPFYRISNKLNDGVTGTGIGLAIARQLAQLHGGEIKLIPTEQGACFEVKIKAEKVVERA